MNVRIFHNGEIFLEGEQAIANYVDYENEYDEVILYLLEKLENKDVLEHSGYGVGHWRVEKM